MGLAVGTSATLRVPASSANLGPGFDCVGMALGVWDQMTATVTERPGLVIEVTGSGAGEVPLDENHLVHRTMVTTWQHLGVTPPQGLHLSAVNEVPHGRGLGSSATAIVMGVALAHVLAAAGDARDGAAGEGPLLDLGRVNALACALEGHPDNASASVFGGATLSTTDGDRPWPQTRTVPLRLHPEVTPHVLVPKATLSTHTARSVLPDVVALPTAAAHAARVGLLVHALTVDPGLLLEGTRDLLHQEARRPSYPESMALVDALRAEGLAATISGAGPSVLVLTAGEEPGRIEAVAGSGATPWRVLAPGVPERGVHAVSDTL